MLSGSHPRAALDFGPGRWACVCLLSSVLLLLGLTRPALAQTTTCSATSVAITGITEVTIDMTTDTTGLPHSSDSSHEWTNVIGWKAF